MKPKLHLKDLATVKDTVAPQPAKAQSVFTPMPMVKCPPLWAQAREFRLTDGRPITIVRHGVNFFTPAKDNPDGATLVSMKGGRSACPLAIAYAEFKAWWEAK